MRKLSIRPTKLDARFAIEGPAPNAMSVLNRARSTVRATTPAIPKPVNSRRILLEEDVKILSLARRFKTTSFSNQRLKQLYYLFPGLDFFGFDKPVSFSGVGNSVRSMTSCTSSERISKWLSTS